MIVYVLVATAVYDHGVIGAYESESDARAAADMIWPQTDGHHAFRIDERVIGVSHKDVFNRAFSYFDEPQRLAEGPTKFVDEDGMPT